jgi:hypothetical protein
MRRWLARQTTRCILARWVQPCGRRRRIVIELKQWAVRWTYVPYSRALKASDIPSIPQPQQPLR